MNKKTSSCSCDSNCQCGSYECHVSSHSSGKKFWFWASIRVIIIVGLIIGAFLIGVRMGFGEFTTRLGVDSYERGKYYGSMHHKIHRDIASPRECQYYMNQKYQTGTILPAQDGSSQTIQ